MRGMRMAAAAVTGALFGAMALTGPAEATIFDRLDDSGTVEDSFPVCGIDIEYEDNFSVRGHIRKGKGKRAGAFFLHQRVSSVETFTNPENGHFFTVSHDLLFKEIKATPVEGNVFEFVDHESGQPFVVRDSDGNVLLRDRGLISFTYLFDTGGDDEPGGEFIAPLDLRVSGPHPGFFLEEGDECPTVIDLLT
jgi:hypothetical protein